MVWVWICILAGITFPSYGQYTIDSLDLDQDVSSWFDKKIGVDQTHLVSGSYKKVFVSRNTHPFFQSRSAIKGTLAYKNDIFEGVDMFYNTHEDFVVITHPTNAQIYSQPIRLDQPGIDWFVVNGRTFRNFDGELGRTGYYEILVESRAFVLVAKRSKLQETNSSTRTVEFTDINNYYLFIDDQTYSGQRKGSFIKVFPNLKKEINTYVRNNGLRIGVKHESDIVELAQYCDQLMSVK